MWHVTSICLTVCYWESLQFHVHSKSTLWLFDIWSLFYSILSLSFLGEILAMLRLLDIYSWNMKKARPKRNSCFTSAMIKHNWAHCTVHMGVPSTLQWATLMPQYATHTEANCCYPEMLRKWLVAPHVRWASEDTHHWSSTLRQAARSARCTGYNDSSSSAALQDNAKKTEENQHVSRLRNA